MAKKFSKIILFSLIFYYGNLKLDTSGEQPDLPITLAEGSSDTIIDIDLPAPEDRAKDKGSFQAKVVLYYLPNNVEIVSKKRFDLTPDGFSRMKAFVKSALESYVEDIEFGCFSLDKFSQKVWTCKNDFNRTCDIRVFVSNGSATYPAAVGDFTVEYNHEHRLIFMSVCFDDIVNSKHVDCTPGGILLPRREILVNQAKNLIKSTIDAGFYNSSMYTLVMAGREVEDKVEDKKNNSKNI